MRQQCVQAVTQAAGRALSQAELKGIEERLVKHMRRLAADDPAAFQAMGQADRLRAAAKAAADEVKAEAAKKAQRVAQTILARSRMEQYVQRVGGDVFEAISRTLAFSADGKSGIQSIESQARAIRDQALSQMLDIIDATQGRFLGFFENAEGARTLLRELHGEDTGVPEAKAAAAEFRAIAEQMRQRFNRGGGDVGYLEDWGVPHHHSQMRVAQAGREQWVADILPLLNRAKYVNPDGTPMTDAQLIDFLGEAWATIATGGLNKLNPGQHQGSGMRANRGSESRVIHFKDADSYLAYQAKYGERGLLETLIGHIDRAARDIALVETLGPNPNHAMRVWLDEGQKAATLADPAKAAEIAKRRRNLETLYDEVAGNHEPPASAALADGFDTYRALNVASRLGSAVITSIADFGTIGLTAKMNRLPLMQVFANELRMLNPLKATDRRLAQRAGLGIGQLVGSLNRFGADGLGVSANVAGRASKVSQKFASAVMRASGMNALTAGSQRAFGATMMDALGDMSRRFDSLAKLDAADRARLEGAGITEADWAVWRLAQPEDWRGTGDTVLTANAIYRIPDAQLAPLGDPVKLREQAATKLLGFVLDETHMAVIEPGVRERAFMHGKVERGTWKGELARSFWQFKSFAVAMAMRHWARGMAQPGWGKAGYLGTLMATTTFLGAIAIQLNEIASFRDPRDMTDPRFGIAALLKGGSLGIFGDFLFDDQSQQGGSFLAALGGPIAGDVEDLLKLTVSNVHQAARGKETHAAAELIRFAKGHTPFANLWYTKAALNHMVFHSFQEAASPGYLRRMKRRAQKEFGQSYWWEPGEMAPYRAPDFSAALGD